MKTYRSGAGATLDRLHIRVAQPSEAVRYSWGDGCDGWRLLQSAGLGVIVERVPAGASEVAHHHVRAEQFFYVLEGVAALELPDETLHLQAGQGVHVPAGLVHRLFNPTQDAVDFLVISSPPTAGDRIEVAATQAGMHGREEKPTRSDGWPARVLDALSHLPLVLPASHTLSTWPAAGPPQATRASAALAACGTASERLFVYGTLAPGRHNADLLSSLPGVWLPATVRGRVIEAGWGAALGCPGIVLDEEGDEVPGLVFASDVLAANWERLDRFEGPDYERRSTTVTLANGERHEACIYSLRDR